MNTSLTDEHIAVQEEQYIPGIPIDTETKHSNTYYEQYIEMFSQNTKRKLIYRFVKRFFDIFMSFLLLVLLSPIMLAVAIAIKIDSRGPVIFKQERMGKNGKIFKCYKFRSMKIDTPRDCATSCLENPEQYYTKVGRFIRKLSIDEFPQLWCVFIGTMSFIGYRPLILTEKNCNDMRTRLGVFKMRPGISGYAQVRGRDKVYYKNKALMDAEYVRDANLWLDIKLAFLTVWVVLRCKNNRSK